MTAQQPVLPLLENQPSPAAMFHALPLSLVTRIVKSHEQYLPSNRAPVETLDQARDGGTNRSTTTGGHKLSKEAASVLHKAANLFLLYVATMIEADREAAAAAVKGGRRKKKAQSMVTVAVVEDALVTAGWSKLLGRLSKKKKVKK